MQKIKLAIVSPYPPSQGTLNEYAYHLVKHMRNKSELSEITLISDQIDGQEDPEEGTGNVPMNIARCWKFNSLTNIFRIWRAARKSKADMVLFNIHFLSFGDGKIAAALGLLTPLLLRLTGIPTMVLLHNIIETVDLQAAGITQNPVLSFLYRTMGTLITRMVLSANIVAVTISSYVEILEKKYKAKNVALIPHGTFELPSLPDFSQAEGPKKVMAFGKFGTYKKVESMIEAVEDIRSRTSEDIEIVIAGTDSPNSLGYLQAAKEKYSHVPQLTFTGYVPEADVARIFTESAIVVFPYESTTGSSGVLHQAGSYGKAAILPNIGDLKSLIEEEGYTGEYFNPSEQESLTQAIQILLEDDEKRIAMARKNYAASASLPMPDIVNWYLLHFRSLIVPSAKMEGSFTLPEFTKPVSGAHPIPSKTFPLLRSGQKQVLNA